MINRKFLGVAAVAETLGIIARQLTHRQTNFLRMLWKFNSVYNPRRQYADHLREVRYELPVPKPHHVSPRERSELYIHRRPASAGV